MPVVNIIRIIKIFQNVYFALGSLNLRNRVEVGEGGGRVEGGGWRAGMVEGGWRVEGG